MVTADGGDRPLCPPDLLDAPRTYSYNGVTLTVAAEDGNGLPGQFLRLSHPGLCPYRDHLPQRAEHRVSSGRIVIQLTGGAADSSGVDIVIG